MKAINFHFVLIGLRVRDEWNEIGKAFRFHATLLQRRDWPSTWKRAIIGSEAVPWKLGLGGFDRVVD